VRSIVPDVVLPISDEPERQVCIAVGPALDEVLWLTAPKTAFKGSLLGKATVMHLHSYRSGPHATTQPYRGRHRPHFVQRCRDGVLLASARVTGDEPNAWFTDRSLKNERRLPLGDGLADVRVSPAGRIWAAYIDEGVFSGGQGAAGLVRFDRRGRPEWQYDASKAGTDDISEVYAFNLAAENEAWVYFYTAFAIVRWLKGTATVWQTRIQGARAMALRSNRALLLGDYDDPTLIRILDLPRGGGSARVKDRLRLSLPERTDPASIQAYGAADRLILWSDANMMILENW
jgi:hypothetical protein